jgi:hypothetical protein
MPLLKWFKSLFGGASGGATARSGASDGDPHGIYFYFRCDRCGEIVRVRANRRNDINREEDGPGALVLRKEVMGNKCYQLMSAEIWLNDSYQVVNAEVTGGKLADVDDYEAQQAAARVDSDADKG